MFFHVLVLISVLLLYLHCSISAKNFFVRVPYHFVKILVFRDETPAPSVLGNMIHSHSNLTTSSFSLHESSELSLFDYYNNFHYKLYYD